LFERIGFDNVNCIRVQTQCYNLFSVGTNLSLSYLQLWSFQVRYPEWHSRLCILNCVTLELYKL